jgi:hypothetical protein
MPPLLGRFDAEADFRAIMGNYTGGEVGRPDGEEDALLVGAGRE